MKIFSILFILIFSVSSYAHCQIPCGIYDDEGVFSQLKQHVETIHKSVDMIVALSSVKIKKLDDQMVANNQQQLTRWVVNKEEHAKAIQDLMAHYFLSQRLKLSSVDNASDNDDYVAMLTVIHEIIVFSMKSKQSVDLSVVESLANKIDALEVLYFKP